MSSIDRLRRLGLFDARAPRYTSYPPANHFNENVGPATVASWLQAVPSGRASRFTCTSLIAGACAGFVPAGHRAPARIVR